MPLVVVDEVEDALEQLEGLASFTFDPSTGKLQSVTNIKKPRVTDL